MNDRTPAPSDDKIARRNYIVFSVVSALFLFIIVLVGALLVNG